MKKLVGTGLLVWQGFQQRNIEPKKMDHTMIIPLKYFLVEIAVINGDNKRFHDWYGCYEL